MVESIQPEVNPLRSGLASAIGLLAAALPGLYLLITSTTTLVPFVAPYDFKRMLEFGLLLVLFLLPTFNRHIQEELGILLTSVPVWIGATFVGVFAWGIVSAMVNAQSPLHLANSLSEVALLSSLLLGVFVVAACRRLCGHAFDRLAIGLLALMGLAVGLQELLGVLAALSSGSVFSYDLSLLHFAHPRFYNQVQSWTIPVLAAIPLIFRRSGLVLVFCLIALGLQWYILLMSGARGSILSLAAAMILSLVLLPMSRKQLLTWQLAGIFLGAAIYGLVLLSFEHPGLVTSAALAGKQANRASSAVLDRGYYGNESGEQSAFLAQSLGRPMSNTSGRIGMWKGVVGDSRAHPVLGIGPMNYACTGRAWFGHPHSFALQLVAEWGIPAALAVLVIVLATVFRAFVYVRNGLRGNNYDTVLGGLLLTGLLAAGAHSFLSGIMVMPASQVTGLLLCGTLLGVLSQRQVGSPVTRMRWAFIPGAILCLVLLAIGSVELRTMESRAAQLDQGRWIAPRIWQNSKVCTLYVAQNAVSN